ncbi:MAG: AAA family ATPase [Polyangiales bacterium]
MSRDRNALGTFLPMDRRLAITRGAPLPERVQGAALLGDLSGFTALTRAFVAAYGPQRGAEEMRQAIDGLVRPLLDAVHAARGAIIGFTGDGLTCWFDDDDGRRALACGLRLQALMAAAPAVSLPDGSAHAMRLKVAVAAGPARRCVVGDPALRLVDTLVGGTLDRVASAEAVADPGDVVADLATLDALGAAVTRGDLRGGGAYAAVTGVGGAPEVAPWPEVEAPDDAHAAPWIHARVRERLRAGDYATELRLLVTVMVRLPRFDFDGDAGAVAALDAWVRHLQRAADTHGGALFDLVVGDKGAYALVCFGAPTAHEDDPARALRAARLIALGPDLPDAPGRAQVGVAAGDCWTGLVGADALRTYGVLGTDVNLAARLMTLAAPGEVLVTERVRAAAPGFSFEPRGTASLKGFGDVGTHQCVGEAAAVRRLARALPMVGRQAERDALTEALAALQAGRGGAVFFEAEPGAGKSRLLQEAVDLAARATGVRVLVGVGSALEQRTPWHAWRDALAALLAHEGDEALDADAITRRVRALAPELADLAPLVGAVLGVVMDEGPLVAGLAGDGRANRTEEVLATIVDVAARRGPLLLALDDLQFFDSASLALVRAVRARSPNVLAVMAARITRDPSETLSELRAAAPRVFPLTRLTFEEVSALARVRLGLREIDGEVAAWIHRHADGNPFFTEQLTFALRDSGGLLARDGVAHLHDTLRLGEAHDLPDAIRRVTTSRFDRLPPDTLLTLKVASVVGRVFTPDTVRAIHPSPPEERALVAQFDALCELELMQIEGVSGADRSYGFIHAIACDVAYGLLPFAQRASLHAALARWIESRVRGDERARDALLAHHWSRAEQPAVALPYLGRAGFAALDASAYREAASLFQAALDTGAAAPPSTARAGAAGSGRPTRASASTPARARRCTRRRRSSASPRAPAARRPSGCSRCSRATSCPAGPRASGARRARRASAGSRPRASATPSGWCTTTRASWWRASARRSAASRSPSARGGRRAPATCSRWRSPTSAGRSGRSSGCTASPAG